MRDRRVEVTRAAGRRRLRRLVVVIVLVGAVFGAGALLLSPLLDVDDVTITGAGPRVDEVRKAAEVEQGAALLLIDTGAVADRIESLAWVADAEVTRELPGTLAIRVTSRAPVAFVARSDGTFGVVDPTATVVSIEPTPPAGLASLVSTTPDAELGDLVKPTTSARVAAHLGPLAGRVERVSVERGQAALLMAGGPEVRLGGLDRLDEKARAADAVLATLAGAPVTYVDVRVPSAPVTG
jgi:cell division protein FtsQ